METSQNISNSPRDLNKQIVDFEDLLGEIWLYINWFEVTRHLDYETKERFADAVDACSKRMATEAEDHVPVAVRWWHDNYDGPFPKTWRR